MPITLNDAIRRVRARVDEPAYPTLPGSTAAANPPRFYTDTEITDWVNDGLRDIARRGEGLRTYDTSMAIPAYAQNPAQPIPTYPLPTDILRVNRVEFQVSGNSTQTYPLEQTTPQYLDQMWAANQISTRTYPSYWVTRGFAGGTGRSLFVIQIYPQSAQAGVLNLFYYRLPFRIGDPVANPSNYTVQLDCIEGWDDLVIDYAGVQALIKARSPDWEISKKLYEEKMANVIDQTRLVGDQAQYMTWDNPMGWGGWDMWGGDW